MLTNHAQAIRSARLAVGLTQDELGRRVGVKGRAIHRWERGASVPTRRNRAALITAVGILNTEAGANLKAALEESAASASSKVPLPAPVPIPAELTMQLAVASMADELDRAPRHVRRALAKMFGQLTDAGMTMEALMEMLESSLGPLN